MADVQVEAVNSTKANFTSVTESPVTDPASGNKVSKNKNLVIWVTNKHINKVMYKFIILPGE